VFVYAATVGDGEMIKNEMKTVMRFAGNSYELKVKSTYHNGEVEKTVPFYRSSNEDVLTGEYWMMSSPQSILI
jgi:hypothetical protein